MKRGTHRNEHPSRSQIKPPTPHVCMIGGGSLIPWKKYNHPPATRSRQVGTVRIYACDKCAGKLYPQPQLIETAPERGILR